MHLRAFQFGFDLQSKFIAHYEKCIFLPYLPHMSSQVLKVYQTLFFFQAYCTQTHAHIHLHTSLQELDLGFLSSFISSFVCEVLLIGWLWLN